MRDAISVSSCPLIPLVVKIWRISRADLGWEHCGQVASHGWRLATPVAAEMGVDMLVG